MFNQLIDNVMIELKFGRDKDGLEIVLNKDEVYSGIEKMISELYRKMNYYVEKYDRQVDSKLPRASDCPPKLIAIRDTVVCDENVKFFVVAALYCWRVCLTTHIVISLKDRKNKIFLFFTKNPACSESDLAIKVPNSVMYAIPIIIQDHFITRFLERRPYSKNWEWEMIDEIDPMNLNVNCSGNPENWEAPTNQELISMKEVIPEITEDFDIPIVYHSGIKRTRSGGMFIMLSPKKGDMYKIKTYVPKDKLKKNQKEILDLQKYLSEARRSLFGVDVE